MPKELFRLGAPFPTNRQEGVTYTNELANGIRYWAVIDTIVIPLAVFIWLVGVNNIISTVLLSFVVCFAIGCPIIMILGFSIGCLRYLKPMECYEIVKKKLTA